MENLEKRFNGKQVIILADNIMIIPDEPPKKGLFKDSVVNYVFPHPVSTEEVKKAYEIIIQ